MTIKDIAKKADVSVATVSRVVNGYKWVSDDIRKRVMAVVEAENYRPNYNASVMATGKSNMIVIVIPESVSPFFAQFTSVATKELKAAGYVTMLYQTYNDVTEEIAFFGSPFAQMADGIISVTDGMDKELLMKIIQPLKEKQKPVLFIDRYLPPDIADCVVNDNIGGMKSAVNLLHKNGHHQIGIILGRTGMTIVHDKIIGFHQAMESLDLPVDDRYIRMGDWTVETGYLETQHLLSMSEPPTAIIACNNFICEGALKWFDHIGLQVGKDISLIGVEESSTDTMLFSWLGITTLKLDSERAAIDASRYMVGKLKHNPPQDTPPETKYPMELIVRKSVVNLNKNES